MNLIKIVYRLILSLAVAFPSNFIVISITLIGEDIFCCQLSGSTHQAIDAILGNVGIQTVNIGNMREVFNPWMIGQRVFSKIIESRSMYSEPFLNEIDNGTPAF
jgi:hypothetical protein